MIDGLNDTAHETAPWRRILNADRRGWVLIGECTSDTGVHVHRNAISMCVPAHPYAAGCLTVAARPPERRRRSGALGRRWERPPLSGCLDRHRGGCACARPWHPPTGGRSRPAIPCGKAIGHLGRARPGLGGLGCGPSHRGYPALLGDARLPDGRPVGERVTRRLEAALKPPSRVGIDGSGATPRDGGRGVKTHLRPNPYQALGLGGCSPPRPCCPVRHRRPGGDERNSKRPHGIGESGVCASSGVHCVHRPPTSHARSSTAQVVGFSSESRPHEPDRPPCVGAVHQPPPSLSASALLERHHSPECAL